MAHLALFDFDKTLVAGDSFRLFTRLVAGSRVARARAFGWAVQVKLGLLDNGAYKRRVLERFWHGRDRDAQDRVLRRLHERLGAREYAPVVERLHAHLAQGHTVVVLSASPAFYVQAHVRRWSDAVDVVGSRFEEADGTFVNLYGPHKATHARRLIAAWQPAAVSVYTDHLSDLPLLRLATDAYLVNPTPRLIRRVAAAGVTAHPLHVRSEPLTHVS